MTNTYDGNDHNALTDERYEDINNQVQAIRYLTSLGETGVTDTHLALAELWDHLKVIEKRNSNFGIEYRKLTNAYEKMYTVLHALQTLARSWATQETDHDEDTEQQISDGREILSMLSDIIK